VQPYKNLNGRSGVTAYEIGDDWIKVRFRAGGTYNYTYESTGKERVERMKVLAAAGKGLSTFISKHVRDDYASRDG
jgi:hypothetical protein